ncbi:hypothetical protein OG777_29310 [Micromonospora peucetia]|uniref:Uncharacterized protein n=1 Tax=Micromonospora peucetia TaxID=47871 RepID=A0ABZ1ED70_9ACTN|nr:hypothetical protein [Micromonospora peucetia]MCX4391002.1 hypothetical protein [Micromonospora peucetia]WSA31932.1 hypothetical protein OIE14_28060 [Micromonospora peucetia]
MTGGAVVAQVALGDHVRCRMVRRPGDLVRGTGFSGTMGEPA